MEKKFKNESFPHILLNRCCVHEGERNIQCNMCSKIFTYFSQLKPHADCVCKIMKKHVAFKKMWKTSLKRCINVIVLRYTYLAGVVVTCRFHLTLFDWLRYHRDCLSAEISHRKHIGNITDKTTMTLRNLSKVEIHIIIRVVLKIPM